MQIRNGSGTKMILFRKFYSKLINRNNEYDPDLSLSKLGSTWRGENGASACNCTRADA